MTDFNPLAGSILGSAQAQHHAAVSKQRQVRRTQTVRKNSAADSESTDHQVESSEDVVEIHDEDASRDPSRRQPNHRRPGEKGSGEESPGLDVTA